MMNLRTIGCLALLGFAGTSHAAGTAAPAQGKAWNPGDVTRLAAMEPAARRAELKAMNPEERRGLWFEVMRQVRANKGADVSAVNQGSASATYTGNNRNAGGKKSRVGFDKSTRAPNAVGLIQYDDNAGSTTFGGGAIIGNRFDTAGGVPVFGSGTVDTVQAVVAQGAGFTTSSAGFVLLGPQTGGGGAMAIFSTFTGATGVTDTVTFTGMGANYTGNSFFVLFGDFANSYVPVFGTGTNMGQGHHGVVGYTGGMGPNITGTFDFGGALNGLVRATGNILPLELANLAISKTDGATTSIAGGTVTYTIVGSNAGPQDAAAATVTDTFPVELSSCNWTCVGAGGGSCTGAGAGNINDMVSLPNLASVTYTATCTVDPAALPGATVSNTAAIAATLPASDPDLTDNTATDTNTITSPASITATKTVSAVGGTFVVGGGVTYTIVVSNAGPAAQADNAGDEFVDTLPAGLTFGSVMASSGTATFNGGTNTVSWNGSIAAGGSVTITINTTIDAGTSGAIVNQGTINFDADGDGTNESVVVTDDPATANPGDGTSFILGVLRSVPSNAYWAMLLLILATLATVWTRRRSIGSR